MFDVRADRTKTDEENVRHPLVEYYGQKLYRDGNRISANEHIAIKVPRVPLSVFALPPMSRTIVSSALFVWQNWMLMCYSDIHVTCLHDEFTASR